MKAKDMLIAVLLIAVIVLGFLYFRKEDGSGPKGNICTVNSTDSCCVDPSCRIRDIFIDGTPCFDTTEIFGQAFEKDSIDYIRSLIRTAKNRNKFNELYGFQIHADHILELSDAIRAFDSLRVSKDGKILTVAGVRLYEAVSERKINGQICSKADLVMVPYLSTGEDVFIVDELPLAGVNFKMYTYFRPCPKLCKDRLYIDQE